MNCEDPIYRPHVTITKGKNVRKQLEQTSNIPHILIPATMLYDHLMVDIYMNFYLSTEAHFLHTKSEIIIFLSVQTCKGRGKKGAEQGLEVV